MSIIEMAIEAANEITQEGCEFCNGGNQGELCEGCEEALLAGILKRCDLGCGELYDTVDEIHCSCWQTHAVDSFMTAEEERDWEEEQFRNGAEH